MPIAQQSVETGSSGKVAAPRADSVAEGLARDLDGVSPQALAAEARSVASSSDDFETSAPGATGIAPSATAVAAVGVPTAARPVLRQGQQGPEVSALQTRLNSVADSGLTVDGDFGSRTRTAVEGFQGRAQITVDGEVGPQTYGALDAVEAGELELLPKPIAPPVGPTRPSGPRSREVTVGDNTFAVHDMVRSEFGTISVPGNRIVSMDSNSVSGRPEILRPLVVIPDDATPLEREAAQSSVDEIAEWFKTHLGGDRADSGVIRTTSENGRGLRGFFHTEYNSVNDDGAVGLIKAKATEFAQILGETLGRIPGVNFIVPHGNPGRYGPDPGAVSRDGSTTEVGLAQHVVREGFAELDENPIG